MSCDVIGHVIPVGHFLLVWCPLEPSLYTTDGFRDIQWRMWRKGWNDLDTTCKQRSWSFILVPTTNRFLIYDAVISNFCSRTHAPFCQYIPYRRQTIKRNTV